MISKRWSAFFSNLENLYEITVIVHSIFLQNNHHTIFKKILELEKDSLSESDDEISDEEMQRISSELKRLGYIKD